VIGRRDFLALAPGVLAASAAGPAVSEPAQPSEPTGAAVIAEARKVVAPHGVERLEAVRIGGIPQWVSVRGADRSNPVLLFIHGGPGFVAMPFAWWFSRPWEDYFTVIHWDQRGGGKTYLMNDPATIAPTMALERMAADASEMIDWACEQYGQRKIYVLGHSWGSYLGLQMAHRHPEKLHAYIGVGQLTNGPESEQRGWAFAMAGARKAGNAKAIAELESVAPYSAPGHPPALKAIYTQRRWLGAYGGVFAFRDSQWIGDLANLSPDYTKAELDKIWDGNDFSEAHLLAEALGLDLTDIRDIACPMALLAGRHDFNVNSDVAAAWFTRLKAPAKQLVWFENSAHMPMFEEPGRFLDALLSARTLAERRA
jgi:pimeloyl-ACP methyl ester carboxylesterase